MLKYTSVKNNRAGLLLYTFVIVALFPVNAYNMDKSVTVYST